MARTVWKADDYLRKIEADTIRELDVIGQEVQAFIKGLTPVRTGYAKRSVYYVIIDGSGRVVGGNRTDDNGEAVPASFPGKATGQIRLVIGAQATYYIYIDLGARGRPGKHILARGVDLMGQRIRTRLAEMKAAG